MLRAWVLQTGRRKGVIVGANCDRVYPDGHREHAFEGVQTYLIPSASGEVFETVFDKEEALKGCIPL